VAKTFEFSAMSAFFVLGDERRSESRTEGFDVLTHGGETMLLATAANAIGTV